MLSHFDTVPTVPLINCCNTAMLTYSSKLSQPPEATSNGICVGDLYRLPLYSPTVCKHGLLRSFLARNSHVCHVLPVQLFSQYPSHTHQGLACCVTSYSNERLD